MFHSLSEQEEKKAAMVNKGKNMEDELRDRQPFRVPESYFEDFTDDFMRRLPTRTAHESKVISIYDRIKPWLYIAATFAGIVILFNVFSKPSHLNENERPVLSSIKVDFEEGDDSEFFEIFEEMYVEKYISYVMYDYLID